MTEPNKSYATVKTLQNLHPRLIKLKNSEKTCTGKTHTM